MDSFSKMYCVYKHTNKINGKVYIGITSRKPEARWKNGYGYMRNEYFYRAIKKYGWNDGFIHEIIASDLTKDSACAIEIELIKAYDSTNPENGYNFSTGGECGNAGCSRSEEWNKKMSAALSKPVICMENSIVYQSVTHAEQQTGARVSSIGAVCRGDYGHCTAGGLHWCFWDEKWDNFKTRCKELGIEYTQCEKCGTLIVKGHTKPRKYCGKCSKYSGASMGTISVSKKKSNSVKQKKTNNTANNNNNKKPMGRKHNTK